MASKYYVNTFYNYNLVQSNISYLRSTIECYDTMAHYTNMTPHMVRTPLSSSWNSSINFDPSALKIYIRTLLYVLNIFLTFFWAKLLWGRLRNLSLLSHLPTDAGRDLNGKTGGRWSRQFSTTTRSAPLSHACWTTIPPTAWQAFKWSWIHETRQWSNWRCRIREICIMEWCAEADRGEFS